MIRCHIFVSISLLLGSACSSTPATTNEVVEPVRLVSPERASYFVILGTSADPYVVQPPPRAHASSKSGTVLYPGDAGAGGFVASIFMHAALQSGIERARQRKFAKHTQENLAPHQEMLSTLDLGRLKHSAVQSLVSPQTPSYTDQYIERAYVITLDPIFVLSHTSDAWGLASTVRVFSSLQLALEEKDALYTREIYVESTPNDTLDWPKSEVESVFQRLIAQVVQLSREDFLTGSNTETIPQETIRYLANGEKQVERGKRLGTRHNKILFETLRGTLKLVPSLNSE